jgi:hypothetical protein
LKPLRERVLERVQKDICSVCVYEGPNGTCCVPEELGCAIMRNVDDAIKAVGHTHSNDIEPYVKELRRIVCDECEHQDEDGHCDVRERRDCSLDDYFPMLVEIIEEEIARRE